MILHPQQNYTTNLLIVKDEGSFDAQYFFVASELRNKIAQELKPVRVVLYFSLKQQQFYLWPLNVNIGLDWYESVLKLLNKPPSFLESNKFRVKSDKNRQQYRIWHKNHEVQVEWPEEAIGELLGESLGQDNFISDKEHPVYVELTEGAEL